MSNNAMSNETDLDWLARNVHVWPEGKREALVCYPRNVDALIWSSVLSDACWITKDQWLSRRAELQNKPSWKDAPEWAIELAQDSDGKWFFYADTPTDGQVSWRVEGTGDNELSGKGEVIGDWRDTLEKRPVDLSESAVTERLTEATQNVLAAAPNLLGEQFKFEHNTKPVTVSNETVQLEQPIAVTGTGNGPASESAFLIGRVIDLLRTSADHFSSEELAELHQLCDAELTKRDAAVCGGQKYIDAHWFERGELPPVGARCVALLGIAPKANCEVIAKTEQQMVVKWEENGMMDVIDLDVHVAFRPIRTERDELESLLRSTALSSFDDLDIIAGAIIAAGFRKEKK